MSNKLSPESSLAELFDFLRPDEGCKVHPVSLAKRADGRADLMIVITGSHDEANVLMANLMTYVTTMQEVTEQKNAESAILGKDGEALTDEPAIIVP